MRKKRWISLLIAAVVGYVFLLVLLTAVESGDSNASIRSFSDALWYSVVTLSTVGYGDLYPVTVAGKLIGLLFVLLSVGALAFVVGSAVSLLTGHMLPRWRMRMLRRKKWYVFSEMNASSVALARSLAEGNDDGVLLFPLEAKAHAPEELHLQYYPDTALKAAAAKKENCVIFFLDEENSTNYERALSALPLGHHIYCSTEQNPDQCPENLTLFDGYTCCARDYWRRQPLARQERKVLLIGDGRYARELLEQGLAVNVFGPEHCVFYHVFGNWDDFRRNHPHLALTIGINESREEADSLYFHEENWNAEEKLLEEADRIILCCDEDRENMAILQQLRRYFPVTGWVYLRSKVDVPGEMVFGMDRQIYTAQNVMANRLNQAARAMHRIYQEESPVDIPDWEALREFVRQSNIAAADHLLIKIRLLLEDETITDITGPLCQRAHHRFQETLAEKRQQYRSLEHLRWMRFHSLHNWRYGSVRCDELRQHPMMVPFENLSEEEQAKDEYAWQLLAAMAEKLEQEDT